MCGRILITSPTTTTEHSTYFRPRGLTGIEALHARFVRHAYRPHSHPTWTVAVVERGAARFALDATQQRAAEGELFVLEPEAVHTGMAAVPEGWAYKVLYIEPDLLHEWAERDGAAPRSARWVVFRDVALRNALERAHVALAADAGSGLAVEEAVLGALARGRELHAARLEHQHRLHQQGQVALATGIFVVRADRGGTGPRRDAAHQERGDVQALPGGEVVAHHDRDLGLELSDAHGRMVPGRSAGVLNVLAQFTTRRRSGRG